jgi:hypothetical protein
MPSLYLYPLRNWKDQKAPLPAVGIHIADLITRLQVGYINIQGLRFKNNPFLPF